MKYKKFGKINNKISILGFGCMRLPIKGNYSEIDEPEAEKIIKFGIDNGINYLDTADPYHVGNSESFLGKILTKYYRDKVVIATKSPIWKIEKKEDFNIILESQLKKLQTEHIEFYHFHALSKALWSKVKEFELLDLAEKAIKDGKIGHLGFSFHDSFKIFKEILTYNKWEFCQIQYNYMNEDFQAGTKGLKYATKKGLPIIIMEPLLGGSLVNPPHVISNIFDESNNKRSSVEWALQWLWDKPEINLVLSGMSNLQQVKQNIILADKSITNSLTKNNLDLIKRVKEKYNQIKPIHCTKCNYCMPCPENVNIPGNLSLYNHLKMYEKLEITKKLYAFLGEQKQAHLCNKCKKCEDLCPQKINISSWMEKIHNKLRPEK